MAETTASGSPRISFDNTYWAETHEVYNQPPALENYNAYLEDHALCEAVTAQGANWAAVDLQRFGAICGSAEVIEWGFQANDNKPVLHSHNRHGERVDEVRFHPAYHQLMTLSMAEGLHSAHWADARAGASITRATNP